MPTRCGEAECKEFAQALAYVSGEYDHPEAFEKLKNRLEELDRAAQAEREPAILSGHSAGYLSRDHRAAGQSRPREESQREILGADHHRKAVWPGPGFGAES